MNFLLPLGDYPEVLLSLLRALDSDTVEVLSLEYAGPRGERLSSLVDFEFVGIGSTLERGRFSRGAHATSCDAILLGRTKTGLVRAYLMEWKYQEQYIGAESLATGKSGAVRMKRYRERFSAADGPFTNQIPLNELLYDPIYQIVRLGLLGDKLRREHALGIEEARVIVVCPLGNLAYRGTVTAPWLRDGLPRGSSLEVAARSLWRNAADFRMTSPEALLAGIRPNLPPGLSEWSEYIRDRYGW